MIKKFISSLVLVSFFAAQAAFGAGETQFPKGIKGDLTGNVTGNLYGTANNATNATNAANLTGNLTGDATSVGMATTVGKIKGVTIDDAQKADGKALVYKATSGNLEYSTVASGGGSKNYLTEYTASGQSTANPGNGDFEKGTVTGWSLKNSTLGTTLFPTTAPSGTPSANLTLTATTLSIEKKYSAILASSSASVAGDMLISDPFYIDANDKNAPLGFEFSYAVTAQGGLAFTGNYATNSFQIAFWDGANAAWIPANNAYCMAGISSVSQKCTGSFPATSSGVYRMAIINQVASTGAYSITFDAFSVGPQAKNTGAPEVYMGQLPTTGSWTTNATYTGNYWRISDRLKGIVRVALTGAPTAVTLALTLPSGLSIDTAKLSGGTDTNGHVQCTGKVFDTSVSVSYGLATCRYGSPTTLTVVTTAATGTYITGAPVTASVPMNFATGDFVDIVYEVPVSGWSSNVVMSEQTSQTPVVEKTSGFDNVTVTNGGTQKLTFTSYQKSTTGGVDPTNDRINIKVPGDYVVMGSTYIQGYNATNAYSSIQLRAVVNGTVPYYIGTVGPGMTGLSARGVSGSGIIPDLKAGDYVELQLNQDTGATLTTLGVITTFDMFRIATPQTVGVSEKILTTVSKSASASMANAAATPVVFDIVNDTNYPGAYNVSTGEFTQPRAGKITVNALITSAFGGGWGANEEWSVYLYRNGSFYNRIASVYSQAAHTAYVSASGSFSAPGLAGDKWAIYVFQTSGAALSTIADGSLMHVNFMVE